MRTLNISINNKVATYHSRGGDIVCGNSDYQIRFTFDGEWDTHTNKTARFKWGGKHFDKPIVDGVCDVPIITNTDSVEVGVYAGELATTTAAVIKTKRSILCGVNESHPEGIEEYRDEAKKAADEAKAAAKGVEDATLAKQTAAEAKAIAEEAKALAEAGGGGGGVDTEARALAAEAKADANNAMSAATDAIRYADDAIGTANQAKTTAQEAKSAVDGMAGNLLSISQDTNNALQKAEQALQKFDEVDGRLYNAEGQAGDALQYADNAIGTANEASAEAKQAKMQAEDAYGKAQQALEQSSGSGDISYLMRYTYRALQITADFNPWGGCIGDGGSDHYHNRGIAMLERHEGASLQSMLEGGGKYNAAHIIIMHPNYEGVLNYYTRTSGEGGVEYVLVAKGVTRIEETAHTAHTLDMTMFTNGVDLPYLTQDAGNFDKILVPVEREASFKAAPGWSDFADKIVAVDTW